MKAPVWIYFGVWLLAACGGSSGSDLDGGGGGGDANTSADTDGDGIPPID